MKISMFQKLSYRQARNTIVVAFILGILFSSLQIAYDFKKGNEEIDFTVGQILSILQNSAGEAIYNVDEMLAQSVIKGLFKYENIREAQVIDEHGSILAQKERPAVSGKWMWLVREIFGTSRHYQKELFYAVERVENGKYITSKIPIGWLKVTLDGYLIAQNLISRMWLIIVGDILRNIILSFILTLIFYTSLIKPILNIVNQVSSVNPSKPADNLIENPKGHAKGELSLLVQTTNFLLKGFETSLANHRAAEAELKKHRDQLEELVAERTAELRRTLKKVEEANKHIMESIQYAKMIQGSLLPNLDSIRTFLPESFFIWMPRDVVGGDIYYTEKVKDGYIVAVIDCTGHGVPGAFMTMIAASGMRKIIKDEGCWNPSEILQNLNVFVKKSLQQDKSYATSDDGMDAAVCFIKSKANELVFASAKIPLIYTQNGETKVIKGDRTSLGYRHSDLNYVFSNKIVELQQGMRFYLATDGLIDQLGGKRKRRFSSRRLKKIIDEHSQKPFNEQRDIILQKFNSYKGNNDIQDDITVVGFGI